jgi:hypothetical protein
VDIFTNLFIVVVVVIWLALVYWTYSDAKRRIADRFLVGCAAAGALFPFVGSLVYLIVRPPEFLEDVRERDLEIAAAEARLHSAGGGTCSHCDEPIEKDFLRCPSCLRKLREPCNSCSKPLEPEWRICPYCESETAAVAGTPSGAAARRKRPAAAGSKRQTPAGGAARKASTKRSNDESRPARRAENDAISETSPADDSVSDSVQTD